MTLYVYFSYYSQIIKHGHNSAHVLFIIKFEEERKREKEKKRKLDCSFLFESGFEVALKCIYNYKNLLYDFCG